MQNNKKVSLIKSILFTVCSILVLDTFVSPAIIGVSSITLWLATAIIFFIPYGFISAELGSTYPDNGGIATWCGRAFGDFTEVLIGFLYWINVAFWMPAVFTAFSGWLNLAIFPNMGMLALAIVALLMCWLVVLMGIRGIELSVTVSSAMAIIKMAVLVIFGFMGIVYGIKHGLANDFSISNWKPTMDDSIIYYSTIVYNLLGFELIGSIGGKIDNPKKTIPKMIIIAGVAITVIYCFGTFGVLAAIPAAEVDTVDGFVYALKELCTVFGSAQMPMFYILIVLAILTLISNMITWCLGGNEAFMGAGLDKRSKFLGHRHPKFGTADNLYLVMGVVSSVLIILNYTLSGNANEVFWNIFSFSCIAFMICYLYMFVAAIKLKLTDTRERPYGVPGGKVGMWIWGIICFVSVALALYFLIDWDVTGYVFWMDVIGTVLCFGAAYWLYKAGKKKGMTTESSKLRQ